MEPPGDLFDKLFLTKSLDWEYEKDERMVDQDRGPGIHYYRRDQILCSVIAGMDMKNDDYVNLQSIVQELKAKSELNLALFKAEEKRMNTS